MIVRRCFTLTIPILLLLSAACSQVRGERWSRQIANSEWIPLANPRASQLDQGTPGLLPGASAQLPQVQPLSLPPALQQQYQQQLLQLQKTQENIQKLLLIQQQLKAQQQLLQSQTFLPSGFSSPAAEKQLHQSQNSEQISELGSEDLVPPLPSSEDLPPVYPAQNFLPQRPRLHQPPKQVDEGPQEFANEPQSGPLLQHPQNVAEFQENLRQGTKRLKDSGQPLIRPSTLQESGQDDEEEVQLVYVPAETLAQRGQPKRNRGRKQFPHRHQQQQRENQGGDPAISNDQDAFARQLLQQIQMEHEEKTQFFKEERIKEIARLNEEQKALERKSRLQQEAVEREQELQRQREAEKKKKELERLEEMAKQRELERIREAREKQRLEELERRRLAEIRAKEERRREEERQKDLEIQRSLKQQRLEKHREEEARATQAVSENQDAQALPLIRDQHRQHLTEISKPGKKLRGRQRQRNQFPEQNYRETTTTPSPNQPPLAVYMGANPKATTVKVSDVLRILKDAKTIAVLDTVGPDTPRVFVGPTNLDPPIGYAKFDLPYLSSIDHNRVERKVDKLPFFVAPLSFDPPPGYSKIPFPAPHIGSVVVNTLDNLNDDQNPNPTPLIEPNSYIDSHNTPDSTTPSYETQTTPYQQATSPKYESTYSAGLPGSRLRFRQFYDKPNAGAYYDDQRPTTRKHKYYDERITPESSTQAPKVESSLRAEVAYSSTPSYQGPVGPREKEQEFSQYALINHDLNQQREAQRYDQQYQTPSTTGLNSFDGESSVGNINDVRTPVGPTQYNLPAELPAISPQLPGLVNSLLEKHEAKLKATTTTTTTTTARPPTTTYRPRGRQRNRVVSTRPRTTTTTTTTQTPSTRTTPDRTRRPFNRSRSRFTTTTEEYRESGYEPTKSKVVETTAKYSTVEHRRPAVRTQKYRNREKASHQTETLSQNHNIQAQQSYENIPQDASTTDALHPSGPETLRQQDEPISSSIQNDFAQQNYPTTLAITENYPALREVTPLVSEAYTRTENYPQSRPQEVHYRGGYEEAAALTGLEKTPVNGFNYQAGESLEQAILQRPKEFPQLDAKSENVEFDPTTTEDPRTRSEEHRYSSIYDVNVPQTEPEYGITLPTSFHRLEAEKVQPTVAGDPNEPPIFVPLPQNKQEDYELQISTTELPLTEVTTETTTTSTTPVIIRQRVRARLGGRNQHEPAIQTRPRGSQDEYVRFSAVNQESSRSSGRQGSRTRPRTRQQSHGSQVQTEGNEYIKIHVAQQRPVATTTPPTTTTSTTPRVVEEDVDYGFIRPPNFRPAHPVENRFHAPVTFRPLSSELSHQSFLSNDETAVESSPPQVLKNRQKYQPPPNRRLPAKSATLSTTLDVVPTTERISVATATPDDTIYTVRPKSRTEEPKTTRTRGRVRRPGKKRVTTTTTTESVLEAHNELPLDENYPRLTQQLPPLEQQPLYEENYEAGTQFVPPRNRHQFYEASSENYPPEFVLNFGNLPDQLALREEYDQTQLASTLPRKSTRAKPLEKSASTASDIYGAESQWSTKLTRSSFQPSFASNSVPDESTKIQWNRENSANDNSAPEIITAAPEVSSVTIVVSSDDKANADRYATEEELMGTTLFGQKSSNVPDQTEKLNAMSDVTDVAPTVTTSERTGSEAETTHGTESSMMDRLENFTEQQRTTIDFEKIVKKTSEPPVVKKGTRRRRVRVRVRPAVDDFVTAESQHFNSAVNSLIQGQYKYNPVRESKPTTIEPMTTTPTQKSVLQGFLEEILKNDETRVASTELPDTWTMPTAMTTPLSIADDPEETTLKESTTVPATKLDKATTFLSPSQDFDSQSQEYVDVPKDIEKLQTKKKSTDEKKESKAQNPKKESWTEKNVQEALELGSWSHKFSKEDNNAVPFEGVRSSEKLDLTTKQLKLSNNEMESFSEMVAERESSKEGDIGFSHPKNHRAKWSEVRHPSTFDHQVSRNFDPKSKSTTSIPGLITKNEGDESVKALSDYVKAIFDTMKSAEDIETGTTSRVESTTLKTEQEDKVSAKNVEDEATVESTTKIDERSTKDPERSTKDPERSTDPESTTLEASTASSESSTTSGDVVSITVSPATNATESMLGKVLRTSTTTKVSHMTEICYRGRCIMTRPKKDDRLR